MSSLDLSDEDLELIVSELEDFQLTHGSLLKIPRGFSADIDSPVAVARPIGISVIPTPFPRAHFDQALQIQTVFNELYIRVAEDKVWLERILENLRGTDDFAAKLWDIWVRVRAEGEVQPLRCGIWRSDYMLQANEEIINFQKNGRDDASDLDVFQDAQLKQVEFNTFSCAGGSHATVVSEAHRYLASRGTHRLANLTKECLPKNIALKSIVEILEKAHRAYGPPVSDAKQTAVLMTVQGRNVNICDERPIEYAMSELDYPIPFYRVSFNEVLKHCTLGRNRQLLFQSSPRSPPLEISVVYHRAGYDEDEYDSGGIEARYLLERSRAIKCPTILSHISGFKKIQQELTRPGVLERYLPPEKCSLLRKTFMLIHPLDASPEGLMTRKVALSEGKAGDYVLKPNLEGGSNNVYGDDIPEFLSQVDMQQTWDSYILMQKINAPLVGGVLISSVSGYQGPTVSELGVLGTCIWRRDDLGQGLEVLENSQSGWTFKTKPCDVEEMSVVKGYGCFDCPCLI